MYIIIILKNKTIFKTVPIIYIILNIILLFILLFGKPINNSKCWLIIPYIGTIQPSEFMKITIIIYISIYISKYKKKHKLKTLKDEFKLIMNIILYTFIPFLYELAEKYSITDRIFFTGIN